MSILHPDRPTYRHKQKVVSHQDYLNSLLKAVDNGLISQLEKNTHDLIELANKNKDTYGLSDATGNRVNISNYNPLVRNENGQYEGEYEVNLPEVTVVGNKKLYDENQRLKSQDASWSYRDPEFRLKAYNDLQSSKQLGIQVANAENAAAPYAALAPLAGIAPVFLSTSWELTPLLWNGFKGTMLFLRTPAGQAVAKKAAGTLATSMLGGEAVNQYSKATTGNTFGENFAKTFTNYAPGSKGYLTAAFLGDFANPGYAVGPGATTKLLEGTGQLLDLSTDGAKKFGNWVGNQGQKAIDWSFQKANDKTMDLIDSGRKWLSQDASDPNKSVARWQWIGDKLVDTFQNKTGNFASTATDLGQAFLHAALMSKYFPTGVAKRSAFNRFTLPRINRWIAEDDIKNYLASGYHYPFEGTPAEEDYAKKFAKWYQDVYPEASKYVDFEGKSSFDPSGGYYADLLTDTSTPRNLNEIRVIGDKSPLSMELPFKTDAAGKEIPGYPKMEFITTRTGKTHHFDNIENQTGFHVDILPTHGQEGAEARIGLQGEPRAPYAEVTLPYGMENSPSLLVEKELEKGLPKYTFVSSTDDAHPLTSKLIETVEGMRTPENADVFDALKINPDGTYNWKDAWRNYIKTQKDNMELAGRSWKDRGFSLHYSTSSYPLSVKTGRKAVDTEIADETPLLKLPSWLRKQNPGTKTHLAPEGQLRYSGDYFNRTNNLGNTDVVGFNESDPTLRFKAGLSWADELNHGWLRSHKWDWRKSLTENKRNILGSYVQGPIIFGDGTQGAASIAYPFPTAMRLEKPIFDDPAEYARWMRRKPDFSRGLKISLGESQKIPTGDVYSPFRHSEDLPFVDLTGKPSSPFTHPDKFEPFTSYLMTKYPGRYAVDPITGNFTTASEFVNNQARMAGLAPRTTETGTLAAANALPEVTVTGTAPVSRLNPVPLATRADLPNYATGVWPISQEANASTPVTELTIQNVARQARHRRRVREIMAERNGEVTQLTSPASSSFIIPNGTMMEARTNPDGILIYGARDSEGVWHSWSEIRRAHQDRLVIFP